MQFSKKENRKNITRTKTVSPTSQGNPRLLHSDEQYGLDTYPLNIPKDNQSVSTNYKYKFRKQKSHNNMKISDESLEHNSCHGEYAPSQSDREKNLGLGSQENMKNFDKNNDKSKRVCANCQEIYNYSVSSDDNLLCDKCVHDQILRQRRLEELDRIQKELEKGQERIDNIKKNRKEFNDKLYDSTYHSKKNHKNNKEEINNLYKDLTPHSTLNKNDTLQINEYFGDKYKNYAQYLIDEKVRERERRTRLAQENLLKLQNKDKDKLIDETENSPNFISSNITNVNYPYYNYLNKHNKQYPVNANIYTKYRPEIEKYYESYVDNPRCQPLYLRDNNEYRGTMYNDDIESYKKELEEQIEFNKKYKELLRKKDKQIEGEKNLKEGLRLEEERRLRDMKEKEKMEEFKKENERLMEIKRKQKEQEKKDNEKYKDMYEKMKAKEREEDEWERKRKGELMEQLRNENLNNLNIKNKRKKKEKGYIDNDDNGNLAKEDNGKEYCNCKENGGNYLEKMGKCCNCHRIIPRRLLTRKSRVYNYNNDNNKFV